MEIKSKKKVIIIASICLVLIAAIVCGIVFWSLGGEEVRKKKKVIVIQKGDSTSDVLEDDLTDDTDSDSLFDDDTDDGRVRRELYVPIGGKYVEKYVPEFTSRSVEWNGPKGYVIVYPSGDKELQKSANKLKEYFSKKFGIDLKVVTDKEKTVTEEILIGKTNRAIEDYEKEEGKFAVRLVNSKLLFEGSHYVTVNKAVDAFVSLNAEKGCVNTLDGSSDFVSKLKNGYEYAWGDEFDGSSLDSSKWNKDVSGDSTTTMRFLDDCIKVEDGRMKLYAKHYFDESDPNVEFAVPYSITTTKTMSFKYGYLEMRARIPFQVGAWPAFWLGTEHALGEHLPLDYEIEVDIFENFASLDTLRPNIHKWYSSSDHSQYSMSSFKLNKYIFENVDMLNREYHIYGFEWTDKEMIIYIDGKAYQTFDLTKSFDENDDMRGCHNPMRIILSNHMFTSDAKFKPYAGCEIDARDLPLEFFVDYMRLYQKPNTGALYTAD